MDISNNITAFTDLSDIDHLGSAYLGFSSQQNHLAYQVFADFLERIKPKRILEIGTGGGGFTYFLYTAITSLGLDCELISYDICERSAYIKLRDKGVGIKVEDIFNKMDCKQEVKDFIQQDGITLVLCDGGNKKNEFNILAAAIKPGDYIMAHDYCESREKFYNDVSKKIWNWFEISDDDIAKVCTDNDLTPYNKKAFDSVVWVCRIRH